MRNGFQSSVIGCRFRGVLVTIFLSLEYSVRVFLLGVFLQTLKSNAKKVFLRIDRGI